LEELELADTVLQEEPEKLPEEQALPEKVRDTVPEAQAEVEPVALSSPLGELLAVALPELQLQAEELLEALTEAVKLEEVQAEGESLVLWLAVAQLEKGADWLAELVKREPEEEGDWLPTRLPLLLGLPESDLRAEVLKDRVGVKDRDTLAVPEVEPTVLRLAEWEPEEEPEAEAEPELEAHKVTVGDTLAEPERLPLPELQKLSELVAVVDRV
jgi:hypothetical protein